jgi:hypothetical protein
VAVRDPRDALVSAYRFFEGWFFEPGSIDIEALGRARFVEGHNYYTHLASWWPRRHDPDVLVLAYEQMYDDSEGTVRRVAQFIGLDAHEERIAIACEKSSFELMHANKDKYDDAMMRAHSERACHLPPGGESSKVRAGGAGGHRGELSETLLGDLDSTWRDTIGARFGLQDYEALLEELAAGAQHDPR